MEMRRDRLLGVGGDVRSVLVGRGKRVGQRMRAGRMSGRRRQSRMSGSKRETGLRSWMTIGAVRRMSGAGQ